MATELLSIGAIFLPLLGFFLAGAVALLGLSSRIAEWGTTALLFLAAFCSWQLFAGFGGETSVTHIASWITLGEVNASWSVRIDRLSVTMLVVVTTVSALVHLYAIGYMHHDPHRPRFFAYLSLFTFAMLMLVSANDFLQLFFGWEGVGLASYLLIGFWYTKPSACAASIKAFIMNRIGDFGFLLGIFTLLAVFGSLGFDEVFALAPAALAEGSDVQRISFLGLEAAAVDLICLLLLVGAMGKSAQFLLHTWLPDAMEGPTPVSALLHAATMVTAGVFLLARISPMLELAPLARDVVLLVGVTSAVFMGLLGLVPNDIKRIIAYSTGSQIGFMFAAMGLGAYQLGMYHLVTHAGFKALLFLGAGSVVHAMGDEQDIRKMGGLWRRLPLTTCAMIIGTMGLVAVPLTSGFFSKDPIIEAAWAQTGVGVAPYWLLVFGALLTSFYSWRLIVVVFFGQTRVEPQLASRIHEAPPTMMIPIAVLAVSVFALGYPFTSSFVGGLQEVFWAGAVVNGVGNEIMQTFHEVPLWVKLAPLTAMIIGTSAALYCYLLVPAFPAAMARLHAPLYRYLLHRGYFDYLYDRLVVRGVQAVSRGLWLGGDVGVIDRFGPNGIAAAAAVLSARLRAQQSGMVYQYALVMIAGIAVLIAILFSFQSWW